MARICFVTQSNKIYLVIIPIEVTYIQLLPHITGKNNHKRQRNAQPRHLNGGVELVAGKESYITFHLYSLFNEFTGFSVAARQLPMVTTMNTIAATRSNANRNTHREISALWAKVL